MIDFFDVNRITRHQATLGYLRMRLSLFLIFLLSVSACDDQNSANRSAGEEQTSGTELTGGSDQMGGQEIAAGEVAAGAIAAGITTPLDVVKTLLQTRGLAQNEEIRSVKGLFGAASVIVDA